MITVNRRLFGALVRGALGCVLLLGSTAAEAGQTLDTIKARGQLVCGIGNIAGFALPDSKGAWQGLDVDLCRGLAVAIFNDPARVRFQQLTPATRFTALGTGEVDVLFRISTRTMLRDTTLGLRHTTTYFYDGHGFMVRSSLGVAKAAELRDATICLQQGTTNEQITAEYFRGIAASFHPLVFERGTQVREAMVAGRCDAFGGDSAELAATRISLPNPRDWTILPERFSKEPYGPFVRRDDPEWLDVVRWYTNALIEAEEQGVTQANAEETRRTSTNANTRRLLGVTSELGEALKLDRSWAYNAIRAVGNYGEIYDRNMGRDTPIGLSRGQNDLWTRGGLLYALPMR